MKKNYKPIDITKTTKLKKPIIINVETKEFEPQYLNIDVNKQTDEIRKILLGQNKKPNFINVKIK